MSDSSVIMNSTNCYLVTLKVKAKKAEYNTNIFRIKCVQYWQWHEPESHLKIWISGCAPNSKLPTEPPKKGKFRFSSSFSRIENQLNVFEKKYWYYVIRGTTFIITDFLYIIFIFKVIYFLNCLSALLIIVVWNTKTN